MDLRAILASIKNSSYSEDGMTTCHVAEFLGDPRFISAYRCGEATGSWHGMKLRWRVYTCCWAAQHALSLQGDFVECGVNRGGISRAVIEYIYFGSLARRFFLLDTFCGDPDVAAVNKSDYVECYDDVQPTFSPFKNVFLIKGRIPDTLRRVNAEQVGYLSIDLNNAQPEIAALRYFWPKLVPGAVVVLDDYAYSREYAVQKKAIDDLGRELGFWVLTLPTGQGLIIKS